MQQTDNAIVNEMAKMSITGNVIPSAWYKTVTRTSGKPYLAAIVILADIVYWYRPAEVRDETTGALVGFRKRFNADLLQRSYAQLSEQFGISKKEATNAVTHLESIGVVRKHFRTLEIAGMKMNNVLFIELVPSALAAITFGETCHLEKGDPIPPKRERVSPQKGIATPAKVQTNTEITTENTTRDYYREKHTPPQAAAGESVQQPGGLLNAQDDKEKIAADFEQCWAEYPRKEGKQKARKAFERAVRGTGSRKPNGEPYTSAEILAEVILYRQYIERMVELVEMEKRYIPTGGSWFEREGWADDVPSISSTFTELMDGIEFNRNTAELRRCAAMIDKAQESERKPLLERMRQIRAALPY